MKMKIREVKLNDINDELAEMVACSVITHEP